MAKAATDVVVRDRAAVAEMFRRAIVADEDVSEHYDSEDVQRALAEGILGAESEDQVYGDASLPALSEWQDVPLEIHGVHFNPSNAERGPRVYAVVDVTRLDTGERETRHVGGYRPTSQLLWEWERDKFPIKRTLAEVAKAKAGQSAPLGFKRLAATEA